MQFWAGLQQGNTCLSYWLRFSRFGNRRLFPTYHNQPRLSSSCYSSSSSLCAARSPIAGSSPKRTEARHRDRRVLEGQTHGVKSQVSSRQKGDSQSLRPRNQASVQTTVKRPQPKKAREPKALEFDDQDGLNWGSEIMRPSSTLQERLKKLKQPTQNLITALPIEPPTLEPEAEKKGNEDTREVEEVELGTVKVENIQIKTAEYLSSSVKMDQCPPPKLPEIAVIGRSNVGKSSLINLLTGRKDLALVSKTPGKTRCINHFFMNKSWYLVDLPGYGYAKTSKTNRLEWGSFTQQYFKKRQSLINVLLLIDASVPVQNIDLGCAQWLFEHQVPFSLIFTKIDKQKKRTPVPEQNIATFESELAAIMGELPMSLTTSATDNLGRQELLLYLAQLRELNRRSQRPDQE